MGKTGILLMSCLALPLLVACQGSPLGNTMRSERNKTLNDAMQGWVGKSEGELVAAWGAPYSTYKNRDGTNIVSWRELWTSYSSIQGYKTEICTKTVMIDTAGLVSKWKHQNCKSNEQGTLPSSVPIPKPTL